MVGLSVGNCVGMQEGKEDGANVGATLGFKLGLNDGAEVGSLLVALQPGGELVHMTVLSFGSQHLQRGLDWL
eukprot:12619255-Ditylum_brightwellii.AAC.1